MVFEGSQRGSRSSVMLNQPIASESRTQPLQQIIYNFHLLGVLIRFTDCAASHVHIHRPPFRHPRTAAILLLQPSSSTSCNRWCVVLLSGFLAFIASLPLSYFFILPIKRCKVTVCKISFPRAEQINGPVARINVSHVLSKHVI